MRKLLCFNMILILALFFIAGCVHDKEGEDEISPITQCNPEDSRTYATEVTGDDGSVTTCIFDKITKTLTCIEDCSDCEDADEDVEIEETIYYYHSIANFVNETYFRDLYHRGVQTEYDANGRELSKSTSIYLYDTQNRLTSISDTITDEQLGFNGHMNCTNWDSLGRILNATLSFNITSPFNGYCEGITLTANYNDTENVGTMTYSNSEATGSEINGIDVCSILSTLKFTGTVDENGNPIREEITDYEGNTEIINYTIVSTETVYCE